MAVAQVGLARRPAGATGASILRPRNLALAACVLIAGWLVFVPLSALFYTAFTEDTGFGPGPARLQNFVEAYSGWHIARLFGNSLIFAVGTALVTLVMGGLVAWVVERTDAPGGSLFHALALLSFAIPGLLTAMAWIFVLSPNIGWVNALIKSAFGLKDSADQHLLDGRHDLGAVEPLLPARLSRARPGAARARRAAGGGRAGLGRALLAGRCPRSRCRCCGRRCCRPCCCCSCSACPPTRCRG